MLYSLRSAWTRRASWNMVLMFCRTCRYSSRAFESEREAFFSRGAGLTQEVRTYTGSHNRKSGHNRKSVQE